MDLIEAVDILLVSDVHDSRHAGLVAGLGTDAAVVDGELLKIGENAERKLGGPRIAANLIGRAHLLFEIDGGLLRLQKELANPADAEAVIRRASLPGAAQGGLMDHIFILLGVATHVAHIPAERLEEGIDKFDANLSFVIFRATVVFDSSREARYQFNDFFRGLHRFASGPYAFLYPASRYEGIYTT